MPHNTGKQDKEAESNRGAAESSYSLARMLGIHPGTILSCESRKAVKF